MRVRLIEFCIQVGSVADCAPSLRRVLIDDRHMATRQHFVRELIWAYLHCYIDCGSTITAVLRYLVMADRHGSMTNTHMIVTCLLKQITITDSLEQVRQLMLLAVAVVDYLKVNCVHAPIATAFSGRSAYAAMERSARRTAIDRRQ